MNKRNFKKKSEMEFEKLKGRVEEVLKGMDQNTLRECNDGSGEPAFKFRDSGGDFTSWAEMGSLWIIEEMEKEYDSYEEEYVWTDEDIKDFIEEIYPAISGFAGFHSLYEAKEYVNNRGILDWEWGSDEYSDEEIINDLLPEYVYEYSEEIESFEELLRKFILEELGQNPADYSL